MGHTNSTPNIGLPQFIGTDKPTWLGDINGAMSTIDTKVGNIDAAIATTDAKADNAVADASGAVTTATNAVNTAGAASTTATQANNLATQALTVANNTADLCTLQIVPDVNTNKTAIGTLADLTTTAKDNLVDAINEVAQGGGGVGAWALIGSETGTNPINISDYTATEFYIIIKKTNDVYLSVYVPAATLDATTRYIRQGYYASAGSCATAAVSVSNAAITTSTLNINSADSTASAEILVYGR